MIANRKLQHIRSRDGIWTDFWSDTLSSPLRGHRAVSTASLASKADVTMMSTTITRTTLVTVRLPSISSRFSAASLTSSCKLLSTIHVQFPDSTATHVESVTPTPPPLGAVRDHNTSTSTSHAAQTATNMPPNQAAYDASSGNAASAERRNHHGEQSSKRAIIGGLSGSIAGLLLIGAMIFIFLRRKRLKEEARISRNYNDHVEKQSHLQHSPQPPPAFSSRCESLQTVHRPSSSAPAVDEDHRIIRMSTQHWPRPYAPGGAEGHRGSRSTTQLRVTNPDPSRPTTARRPSQETARSFLSRKRSAIGEALHGAATRLRASSFRTEIASPPPPVPLPADIIYPNRNKPLPTIRVFDRGSTSSTPSFRSYPSLLSSTRPQASPSLASTILPRPPPSPFRSPSSNFMLSAAITPDSDPDKDPFKTPSLETPVQTRPQRPSLAPLQKLWPHSRLHSSNSTHKMRNSPQMRSARSSLLTPNSFTRLYSHRRSQRRSRGGKTASSRGQSKSSVDTLSTARWSKRSDPFDLDRASWRAGRGSMGFGAAVREAARGEHNDAGSETFGAGTKQGLYEGT